MSMSDTSEMPLVPASDKDFYKRGRNWDSDIEVKNEKTKALGWRLFWAMFFLSGLLMIAVIVLVLRHKPLSYMVTVDKVTGETSLVMPLDQTQFSYDELTDKFDIKRYVIARESYNYLLLQRDYDLTINLSCDPIAQEYDKQFGGDKGLDKVLGASTEYRINVISVRLPKDEPGKAVVSFEKTTYHGLQPDPVPPARYITTLSYELRPSMMVKESVWIDNPRGFKVCAYRADPELIGSK